MGLKERILLAVGKIKEGEVRTYKEIAKLTGKAKAWRLVAKLISKNRSPNIPCHRVIRSDRSIGGYYGSYKNSWLKLALLLKEGMVCVMPTDTIYGLCTSALKEKSVKEVYRLKKRSPKKPCIILISGMEDLRKFGIKLSKEEQIFLDKVWPSRISVILKLKTQEAKRKFKYLHCGTNSLAFRLPKMKLLRKILKVSGPLIAPSANWEGCQTAKTVSQARKYFGSNVVYFDGGRLEGKPSSIIRIKDKHIKVIRAGAL